jgi:hypothetical protein
MNINLVKQYIEEYKWNTKKQFQNNYNLDSDDIYSNITSLKKSIQYIVRFDQKYGIDLNKYKPNDN